jgi:hypothetical protein
MSTTVTPTITNGNDDGDAYATTTNTVSVANYHGLVSSVSRNGFYRFALNVPKGATIVTAYVTFVANNNWAAGAVFDLYADGHDDSPQLQNVSNLTLWNEMLARKTTATAGWTVGAITAGSTYSTPEIKTLVKEVTDRAGWAANQHWQIMLVDNASTTGFSTKAFDGGSGTYGVLTVEYTTEVWVPKVIMVM